MRHLFISLLLAVLLASCSAIQSTSGKIDHEALMGSRWTLAEMQGKEVKVALNGAVPWLEFQENMALRGHGGCNSFAAETTTPSGAALVVINFTNTERACAALELEQRYFNSLQGSFTLKLEGNKLSLLNAAGDPELIFIAEPKI